MKPITQIDREEAARYLGFHGAKRDDFTDAMMQSCEKILLDSVKPKFIHRVLPLQRDTEAWIPIGTALRLTGQDISTHLAECSNVILLCATLGAEADALTRRLEISDMAKAIVTDSLCNALIEQVCDAAEEEIKASLNFQGYTARFSPGYGDLPLNIQLEFLSAVDAERKIGVTLSSDFLLTPLKTVTAVIGCADHPILYSPGGCAHCSLASTCQFRKEGKTCANP